MRSSAGAWTAVVGVLVLLLSACQPAARADEDDRPLVLTTFTVLADIARNVAGPHLRVESITKPGAEVHGYEVTPGDLRQASEADLVLDNGMGLEGWFEQFVAELDAPRVVVSEGVEPIDIAPDPENPGGYAGRPNPHAWMSPLNVQRYAATMADAFAELDPAHAADYRAAAERYAAELQDVHDDLVSRLAGLPPEHRALVTCEGAFSYLALDAGLTEVYLWPVNAEQQATPQQIERAIGTVRAAGIPAVFCESTVSDRPMQQVVRATGAAFGGVLYVDSLSEPDGPVPTYLDLIRHDIDLIATSLGGRP
ncbi:metal ABC transporter substrate-binding protein [Desertihabitans aurantiacus]|uniref:metal ABC transporter substrate-binding protein n=1 Tax=Desertihabitans aurantiacus TaxID=2282477 RepID=UPI000DF7C987|nr:metal ABC transporter substrate-binding protein [Desertihabitans aurantiacus]